MVTVDPRDDEQDPQVPGQQPAAPAAQQQPAEPTAQQPQQDPQGQPQEPQQPALPAQPRTRPLPTGWQDRIKRLKKAHVDVLMNGNVDDRGETLYVPDSEEAAWDQTDDSLVKFLASPENVEAVHAYLRGGPMPRNWLPWGADPVTLRGKPTKSKQTRDAEILAHGMRAEMGAVPGLTAAYDYFLGPVGEVIPAVLQPFADTYAFLTRAEERIDAKSGLHAIIRNAAAMVPKIPGAGPGFARSGRELFTAQAQEDLNLSLVEQAAKIAVQEAAIYETADSFSAGLRTGGQTLGTVLSYFWGGGLGRLGLAGSKVEKVTKFLALPSHIMKAGGAVGGAIGGRLARGLGAGETATKVTRALGASAGGFGAIDAVSARGEKLDEETGRMVEAAPGLMDVLKGLGIGAAKGVVLGAFNLWGKHVFHGMFKTAKESLGKTELEQMAALETWAKKAGVWGRRAGETDEALAKRLSNAFIDAGAPGAKLSPVRKFSAYAALGGINATGFSLINQQFWSDLLEGRADRAFAAWAGNALALGGAHMPLERLPASRSMRRSIREPEGPAAEAPPETGAPEGPQATPQQLLNAKLRAKIEARRAQGLPVPQTMLQRLADMERGPRDQVLSMLREDIALRMEESVRQERELQADLERLEGEVGGQPQAEAATARQQVLDRLRQVIEQRAELDRMRGKLEAEVPDADLRPYREQLLELLRSDIQSRSPAEIERAKKTELREGVALEVFAENLRTRQRQLSDSLTLDLLQQQGWETRRPGRQALLSETAEGRPAVRNPEATDATQRFEFAANRAVNFDVEGGVARPSQTLRELLSLPESMPVEQMAEVLRDVQTIDALQAMRGPGTRVSSVPVNGQVITAVPGNANVEGTLHTVSNGRPMQAPLRAGAEFKEVDKPAERVSKDHLQPEQQAAVRVIDEALTDPNLPHNDRVKLTESREVLDTVAARPDVPGDPIAAALRVMPELAKRLQQDPSPEAVSRTIQALADVLIGKSPEIALADMIRAEMIEAQRAELRELDKTSAEMGKELEAEGQAFDAEAAAQEAAIAAGPGQLGVKPKPAVLPETQALRDAGNKAILLKQQIEEMELDGEKGSKAYKAAVAELNKLVKEAGIEMPTGEITTRTPEQQAELDSSRRAMFEAGLPFTDAAGKEIPGEPVAEPSPEALAKAKQLMGGTELAKELALLRAKKPQAPAQNAAVEAARSLAVANLRERADKLEEVRPNVSQRLREIAESMDQKKSVMAMRKAAIDLERLALSENLQGTLREKLNTLAGNLMDVTATEPLGPKRRRESERGSFNPLTDLLLPAYELMVERPVKAVVESFRSQRRELPPTEGPKAPEQPSPSVRALASMAGTAFEIPAARQFIEPLIDHVAKAEPAIGRKGLDAEGQTREVATEIGLVTKAIPRTHTPSLSQVTYLEGRPSDRVDAGFSRAQVLGETPLRERFGVNLDSMTPREKQVMGPWMKAIKLVKRLASEAGLGVQGRYTPEGELAAISPEAKQDAVPRYFKPRVAAAIAKGEGRLFEDVTEAIASANGLPVDQVRQNLREREYTDARDLKRRINPEVPREYEFMPDTMRRRDTGEVFEILEVEPLRHAKHMEMAAAKRIGTTRVFGPDNPRAMSPIEIAEAMAGEGIPVPYPEVVGAAQSQANRPAVLALMRALSGMPTERPDRIDPDGPWHTTGSVLSEINNLAAAAKMTGSAWVANLTESYGTANALLGREYMGPARAEVAKAVSEGRFKEALEERERAGGFSIQEPEFLAGSGKGGLEKFLSGSRTLREAFLWLFHKTQNTQDVAIHKALFRKVADWRQANSRPGDAEAIQTMFGLSRAEAQQIISGQATPATYRMIELNGLTRITRRGDLPVNKSEFARSQGWKKELKFVGYFQNQMQRLSQSINRVREAETKEQQQAAVRAFAKLVGFNIATNIVQQSIVRGISGLDEFFGFWGETLDEATSSPLGAPRIALTALLGSMFGAPGAVLTSGISGLLGGDKQDKVEFVDRLRTAVPGWGAANDMFEFGSAQYANLTGQAPGAESRYSGKTPLQQVGHFIGQQVPGVRWALNGPLGLGVTYLGTDPGLEAALRASRRISTRLGIESAFHGGDATFLHTMRKAVTSLRGDEDPSEVAELIRAALPDKEDSSIAASLLDRRALAGPSWDELSEEQQASKLRSLGENRVELLRGYDAVLERAARHFQRNRGRRRRNI